MTSGQISTDKFLEMWMAWEVAIPPTLSGENPRVFLRLLELCATSGGVFQVELKSALDVNQSYLSKLTTKLCDAGLVKVSASKNDLRKRLVKTSAVGLALLTSLDEQLKRLDAVPSVSPRPNVSSKTIRPSAGQTSFDLETLPRS